MWLAVAAVLGVGSVASAEPLPVRAVSLPSRRPVAALRAQADDVTRALAARLGVGVEPRPDPAAQRALPELASGLELWAAGDLDRAAELLDRGLTAGAASPHRVADPRLFVTAHVARASIALARGEPHIADHLLRRAVEYDPVFALQPGERSPRVERALLDVREQLGARPELRVETLGDACAGAVAVVARDLPDGSTEFLRFDDCRLVGSVVATARQPADAVAAALAPIGRPPPEDRPFYESPWFWAGTAAVAVLGGTALYFATRDDPELTIVPHF